MADIVRRRFRATPTYYLTTRRRNGDCYDEIINETVLAACKHRSRAVIMHELVEHAKHGLLTRISGTRRDACLRAIIGASAPRMKTPATGSKTTMLFTTALHCND